MEKQVRNSWKIKYEELDEKFSKILNDVAGLKYLKTSMSYENLIEEIKKHNEEELHMTREHDMHENFCSSCGQEIKYSNENQGMINNGI